MKRLMFWHWWFFFLFLGLENVALHKIAWQKYPLGDNQLSALLAIDGRKANLSHWGGQCVASRYGRTSEWRVDLKGLYSIHHIVILYVQYQRVWGIYFFFSFNITFIEQF